MKKKKKTLGTENVRWDLSRFYGSPEDPQIGKDLEKAVALMAAFDAAHRGKLGETLGAAIRDLAAIDALENKIFAYFSFLESLDTGNAAAKTARAAAETAIVPASADHCAFFDIELCALPDETLAALAAADATVAKHLPWIKKIRERKTHLFSEEVEKALGKYGQFGTSLWGDLFDELESDLRVRVGRKQMPLEAALHVLSESTDPGERAETLAAVNAALGGHFAKYSAQMLWATAGEHALDVRERKYAHPMDGRNRSNNVPDDVVAALHEAVREKGGEIARRYYRLKAKLLGLEKLRWADRNAPMPFKNEATVPYGEALDIVRAAYAEFSPTLARIVERFVADGRIDAHVSEGRQSGAYNHSFALPDGNVSFTFMNYLGSPRDVMTLAHELGHGVHGILAGEAQGPLMAHAPIAYCETASIFGEATTFNWLKKKLEESGDETSLLALFMSVADDAMNTVVRQIGFSDFERRLHGMDAAYEKWEAPRKRSAAECDALWLETLERYYGKDGDVFAYENAEHLWAYISHFHRPFYVYGYAFGLLLTHSLYAQKERLGGRFEPLYLDLLRAGMTKNAKELLAPFGLDPTDPAFWTEGLRVGVETPIAEAEALAAKLGLA